jgi:hypothetical protein
VLYALCALVFVCTSSALVSAEIATNPSIAEQANVAGRSATLTAVPTLRPATSAQFTPSVQLARKCKASGKSCTKNSECCSGNCQKGTDMPSGTCMHGD